MKRKYTVGYILERAYPYIIAFITMIFCWKTEFIIMRDNGYTDLIDGLVTLDSIIIGFLGAIMPVVLSMKNESKFVKYVFEKDTDNLFRKYLKITVLLGIVNVVTSLAMYVRATIPEKWQISFYYLWMFITIAFLATTYRSMSHMITLIFMVSAKYSCGFSNFLISSIIVGERYLDYFTTITEDRLWQLLAKPVFRWRNRSDLSMNAAKAA